MSIESVVFRVAGPVLLLFLLGSATPTWAQQIETEADLPVFGIGAWQVFRFSVAALPDLNRDRVNGSGCVATMSFRDTRNRPFGPRQEVNLQPGEVTFLELDGRSLGLSWRQRMDFRPILSLAPESGGCEATFSILDPVGRVVSQGPSKVVIFELEVSEPFGGSDSDSILLPPPFGWGQTLRATVVRSTNPVDVNNAPKPCDVTLNLRKGGQVVASLDTGFMTPGQVATVSVPFEALGLPFGETAALTQEVIDYPTEIWYPWSEEPVSTSSSSGCTISYQVLHTLTQSTQVIGVPLKIIQLNQ